MSHPPSSIHSLQILRLAIFLKNSAKNIVHVVKAKRMHDGQQAAGGGRHDGAQAPRLPLLYVCVDASNLIKQGVPLAESTSTSSSTSHPRVRQTSVERHDTTMLRTTHA